MKSLHAWLGRVRGGGDVAFALSVLAVVALLVTPLGPRALDALLALNLAVAATVLVVTLFAREALRLASFPTLLLLTTLFRLALNVCSTRLVLSRGEAGRVIEAFGRVVVQGDYLVGAVVFAILTLVQLLVVAKGAERVAEVAARFTLDALPGKQMAVDADLRAGAVDQAEARRRRRELERESQLYGAMDGALKFVKGDAVAGVAIVLVNVTGGLLAGAAHGMPLGAAARRYALLAIGDGLVSQIPALILAVAAGVAVTRVAAEEEGGSLSGEMGRQLADPRALRAVAVLLAVLGLAPGLPAAPFLALSAAAAAVSELLRRRGAGGAPRPPPGAAGEPARPAPGSPLLLELADDLLGAPGEAGERFAGETLPALREELWRELGVRLPPVSVRPAPLPPGGWRLLLDEVPAASGRADKDRVVSLASPEDLSLVGIAWTPCRDPASGRALCAVAAADAPRAAALGPVRQPLECVAAAAAAALRRHAHRLVGVQEVQSLLDALEPEAPALVREAGRQLPPALLAEMLRRLLQEEVPVRNLRAILEAALEAGGGARGAAALAEACRRALARHIAHRLAEEGPLAALLLDPAAEAALRDALAGEHAALDPESTNGLLGRIEAELGAAQEAPVLLAAPDLRRALRNLVAPRFPRLPVLSYDELPPEQAVRPVGRIALA
ncbi:MAG TPA: flagellar biosynthesis protein FlhA [Anaeromyxobacteraceae bacterium]|nr:flagellar biosynthesis protein FlhA [Anaeromyxobacteraceae bacterium]